MAVWLNKGQTPRFTFPNGMANCRNAFGRIVKEYSDHWPKEERKNTGIYEARRVVLKYGKMPHIRIHEVKIRGDPLAVAASRPGPPLRQWGIQRRKHPQHLSGLCRPRLPATRHGR